MALCIKEIKVLDTYPFLVNDLLRPAGMMWAVLAHAGIPQHAAVSALHALMGDSLSFIFSSGVKQDATDVIHVGLDSFVACSLCHVMLALMADSTSFSSSALR